jgi:transcriptional regulator with XRE-family HTH domain
MAKKRDLAPWQVEDSGRLKRLYDERAPFGMSQADFAVSFGLGTTQGALWQYLNGVIPLNLSAVLKFARGLECTVAEISPTLAQELAMAGDHRLVRLFAQLTPEAQRTVEDLMILLVGVKQTDPDSVQSASTAEEISPTSPRQPQRRP